MEVTSSCPKVFISYSWTVKDKVKELAERLLANGIDVVLDLWSLKPGQEKYIFMEQSVNDETISKVLVICDKSYCEKANARTGGVGDETIIISPEIYGKVAQEKFIPIVFEKDTSGKVYLPHYMKSRIYIDLSSEDERYEEEYEVLLRNIHNKPQYTKPAIGKRPEWLEEQNVDFYMIKDIIKQLNGVNADNIKKIKTLTKRAEIGILVAIKSFKLDETKSSQKALLETIGKMKPLRDLVIDYIDASSTTNESLSTIVVGLFENLYNSLHDGSDLKDNQQYLVEAYDFFIWELFISISAYCLASNQYFELNQILTHSYYLREDNSEIYEYANYDKFFKIGDFIENRCKLECYEPKLATLQGDLLIKREYKPILTKESLSNADVVLCQLYRMLLKDKAIWFYWYPISYIYSDTRIKFWMRMKSRKYCEYVLPLFSAGSIQELKDLIDANGKKSFEGYSRARRSPMCIFDSIKPDEIGSIN
jgi:hypothetical protein